MNLLDLARSALRDAEPVATESITANNSVQIGVPVSVRRCEAPTDPGVERRRGKALSMLATNPELRIAVVAEAGDPVMVGIAIRGLAYGEIEIAAPEYDPLVLLGLLEKHGGEKQTIH